MQVAPFQHILWVPRLQPGRMITNPQRESPAPDSDGTGLDILLSAASSAENLHDNQIS